MPKPVKKKYFGTDGIRGKVGEQPVTPEFMLKLGWAVGTVLADGDHGKVIIGKDTRISGYMFESALEAGLSAAGVDIKLLGPMPTPAIAYLTQTLHAQAGIVISASHNPYYDNGIKFFSGQGTKLPDSLELAIEAALIKPMTTVDSSVLGKAERINDAPGRYIEFCKSTIPKSTKLSGLKIVVDCAHGATYHIAPNVFDELGADVIKQCAQPDGLNINMDCGSTNMRSLKASVLEHKADLGIAFDGDGDRVLMVDHSGEVVDGDELLFVIANARQKENRLQGGVVGTVMSNLGLEHALQAKAIEFLRAPVGDRYVMEMLARHNFQLGGESSGHIICLDRTTTGDGIVSALQVLQAIVEFDKSLLDLRSEMSKYPQVLINIATEKGFDVSESVAVQEAVKRVESELGNDGRVLLRASGTEPLIRVMVEGADERIVAEKADELAKIVNDAKPLIAPT